MSEKLLPCPFCGSKAELLEAYVGEFLLTCSKNNCTLNAVIFGRKEAIKNWNQRYYPTCKSCKYKGKIYCPAGNAKMKYCDRHSELELKNE